MADLDERLDRFEGMIGELRGHVHALEQQIARLPTAPAAERHDGLKTAITFMAIVVVPILVAILGGYFALRSAGVK